MNQKQTPLFDAVRKHIDDKIVPFHVPGHKHGAGISELKDYLGEKTLQMDLNAMSDIDDLGNPVSVIDRAHKLAAAAFGADRAYFLVNGTTMGIHAMMLAALKPGDEIILPRNAHKSAFTGLILTGAIPVYAKPVVNKELGVISGISSGAVKDAFKKSPHAAAVLVVNPTYYGLVPDMKGIVKTARDKNALVLADEAHGCHFYFHPKMPVSAMRAGADMAAVSTHKTGGSLTQSSILLSRGSRLNTDDLIDTLGVLRTTSSSYLLMCSIDIARRQLALRGKELIDQLLSITEYARKRINKIKGLHAPGPEIIRKDKGADDFDPTKLVIRVNDLGITGFQMESILRYEYKIQIELADMNHVLAYISLGDTRESIDKLVNALSSIAAHSIHKKKVILPELPDLPEMIVYPREAFYAKKISIPVEKSLNQIAGEMIMAYPPGIPIVCPGERISRDMINYVRELKAQGASLQGCADPKVENIRVLGYGTR
jgi:arginine/lysine/ornithine decarboxylase